MREIFFLLLFASFFLTSSCKEKNADDWKLKHERRIDTLVRNKMTVLQDSIDEVCVSRFEKSLSYYVDSIKTQRRAEIKKLIENE